MGKYKYPIGYQFNHLTILEFLGVKGNSHHTYYRCQCDCGKIIDILAQHIQIQKSCGCAPRQMRQL